MAYRRRNVVDGQTVMNKDLYDNVQDGVDESKNAISELDTNKQNNESWVNYTLEATEWIEDENENLVYYPLYEDYPDNEYDIVNVLPVASTNADMLKAWVKASCFGYEPTNRIICRGKVPQIDIVIGLCVRPK